MVNGWLKKVNCFQLWVLVGRCCFLWVTSQLVVYYVHMWEVSEGLCPLKWQMTRRKIIKHKTKHRFYVIYKHDNGNDHKTVEKHNQQWTSISDCRIKRSYTFAYIYIYSIIIRHEKLSIKLTKSYFCFHYLSFIWMDGWVRMRSI